MKSQKLPNSSLTETFERANALVDSSIDSFDWSSPDKYGCFLAQSYHMTKYTTRVAALTAGGIPIERNDIHSKALVHVREENGHEFLAKRDLENLGYSLEEFEESLECKLMLQSQYHFIAQSPYSHFGFVIILERIAAEKGPWLLEQVSKYGKACQSFIDIHARVDVGHVQEMADLISISPAESYGLLEENMRQTGVLYARMLDKINRGVYGGQVSQAA